jgi:homoserine kinase
MTSIQVFAPATVSNVACGFDIFGFAVTKPGDEVHLKLAKPSGIRITNITGDGGKLPREVERNTAGVVVQQFLKKINQTEVGVEIEIHKQMPLGSGMGSSAASAVAALVGINELFGRPLDKRALLPFAMEGERLACGSAHADNVAPSLFGGFVLIRSYEPLDVIELQTPPNLWCVLVHPDIEVRTEDARAILKKMIPLPSAIRQWGNAAALVAGLLQSDYALIGRALEDVIIEPVRKVLIPGFDDVKAAALAQGALGCSLSGSGPSMFALATSSQTAHAVGEAMKQTFQNTVGFSSDVFVSQINPEGPKILAIT